MIRIAILILIIVALYWQVQDAVIYLNDHRYTFPGQLRIFVIKFVSSGTPEPTSQCICRPIIKIWWKMYISSDRRNSRKIRSNISACHISCAVVWPDQPLNDWVIFFFKMWFHFLMLFTLCAIFSYEFGPIQWMFSQHCRYRWPGALAPGHQ